jgi:hypothetical protein
MLSKIAEETREKLKNNISDDVLFKILDTDYEDIEYDTLGYSAIKLAINPEETVAIPQGNPFLRNARQLSQFLKKYKGIYSID